MQNSTATMDSLSVSYKTKHTAVMLLSIYPKYLKTSVHTNTRTRCL